MFMPFLSLLHRNEYLCFQKITKLEYSIPEGFPDNAKDVVTKLLVNSIYYNTLYMGIVYGAFVSTLSI